jgi:hypothetical protein
VSRILQPDRLPGRAAALQPALTIASALFVLVADVGIVRTARAGPPVQYMQICSASGAGYFYIPGTNICQDANQIAENQYNASREFSRAMVGIAMSSAIVTPFIPDNARFGISVHWATYNSKNGLGFGGAMRLTGNWALTGGIAVGSDSGSVTIATIQTTQTGPYSPVRSWSSTDMTGKLGVNYSW